MIKKTYIEKSLKLALKSYNASIQSNDLVALYSKFAILELCGWIEISMDDTFNRLSKKVKENTNKKEIQEKIKINSSFDYDRNYKQLISHIIGVINFEKIERTCDQSKITKMKITLTTLKKERNRLAHTDLRNISSPIPSPSIAISHFRDIYDGLIEIEKNLKTNNHI